MLQGNFVYRAVFLREYDQVVNSDGELILDTRPPADLDSGHVPRKTNISYGDLFDKLISI